jgi:PAS domain S-box-containing protein
LNSILRKAEREYRAIIDSVSDIIFETNTHGEILFLNGTWRKVTGYEAEQAMARNIFDLLHPQDQEEQRQFFEQLVKGQKHAYRVFTRLRTSFG